MAFWSFLVNFGAKAVTGPVKDLSGAAKDATGIRKDLVETKLAQLKLESEESLIQRATLDDVKEYDPKRKRIFAVISKSAFLVALLVVSFKALSPGVAGLIWRGGNSPSLIHETTARHVFYWRLLATGGWGVWIVFRIVKRLTER
jgi:hypothetical protein